MADSLKFSKGLQQYLPSTLEDNTFYVTTDTHKIYLQGGVWEDTSSINETIGEIEEVVAESLTDLDARLKAIEDKTSDSETEEEPNVSSSTIKVTYEELKELRDNGELIPSVKYRITDYVTITNQENTKSANHPFDIIVEALNENTLSEDAKAIIHDNDTYFINNELSAWELKYCIDNDTNRFAWADSTNSKGVIYYLKDEFNNECWYDFKNIQFKRDSSWLTTYKSKFKSLSASSQTEIWFYTFSRTNGTTSVTISDDSLINNNSSSIYPCRNNTIGMYSKDGQQDYKIKHYLNNTIFIGNGAESNHIGENNHNNTFTGIYNNYIDMNCQDNVVSSGFSYNHIGLYFKGNKIFGKFINNNIGNTASGNTVNDTLSYNTIENNFNNNTFNKTFQFNKIENYFQQNVLQEFQYNTVENNFYGNKLNKIDSCNFSDFFSENNSENSGPIERCNFGHKIYKCSDLPSMSSITFDDEVVHYDDYGKGLNNITLSDGRNALNVLSSLGYNNTTQILFTKKGDKYQVIDNFNNSNAINYIHDLGVVDSSGNAEDNAKNANIATNQKIHLIKYSASGKTGLIEQNVQNKDSNNIETKQIIHWDGLRKIRTLKFSNIFGGWTLINDTIWEELKDVKNDEWDSISGNVQENSLKIQENSLKIVYSNQNHDFDSNSNNINCYGYVGTLNNINVKGDDIFIESIAVYTREGQTENPNITTPLWCKLLKFNNNTWEPIYQSTESKTISSISPETLFSFKVKPIDEMNKIIKSTDKIAIVYVDDENVGVRLGFKSVSSPGGLENALTNTSGGNANWCPSFRIGYLSTTDKSFHTSDIILKNPNKDASTSIATNIDGGELKVFKHPSNKAFIVRTNSSDTKGGLNRLELLTTDNYNSHTYKFPFADGTVPLGITVNNTIYSASTDTGMIDLSNAIPTLDTSILDTINDDIDLIKEKIANNEEVSTRTFNYLNSEIVKIQQNGVIGGDGNGNTIISIEWNEYSNLNNYTTTGVYFISGIRKTIEDNLPINSVGDNASISAQLIVTESPEGTTVTRSIIGQTLLLSNADGNETKIYTRSAKKLIPEGEGEYTTTWGDWTVCQGMKEVGQTETFDNYIDNGMYSGLYTKDNIYETFVLITVSNYAVAREDYPKTISQLKIGVGLDASISLTIRRGYGTDSLTWEGWQSILTSPYAVSTMSLMSTRSTMSVDERQDEEINLLREEIENLRASIDYLKDEIKYLNQEINLLSNK